MVNAHFPQVSHCTTLSTYIGFLKIGALRIRKCHTGDIFINYAPYGQSTLSDVQEVRSKKWADSGKKSAPQCQMQVYGEHFKFQPEC